MTQARQETVYKAEHALKPDLPLYLQTPLLQQQRSHQELEPLNFVFKLNETAPILQDSCARLQRKALAWCIHFPVQQEATGSHYSEISSPHQAAPVKRGSPLATDF